ncbi:MAG TPA: SDR family oxidoreductase [Pseudonocardiaceae bacterium]|nr:SDR family oxidoreductase [Pseudonocardiaceae bacterium]
MELGLRGRVVFVTGGSSGIGQATAVAFGREHANVAITYRANTDGAKATVAAVTAAGGQATAVRLELADPDSIRAAIAETTARWGGIDVLVNNAAETDRHAEAFNPAGPAFADIPPEHWRPQLTTGLDGIFHTLQAALPAMRGRDHGRIAFVSSAAAEHGGPREQAYAATKSALTGLTATLARELGPDGILVNIVMPAMTTTDRVRRIVPEPVQQMIAGHLPTGTLSTPDDVANAIVFLCSIANGNITGETLHVTGGL